MQKLSEITNTSELNYQVIVLPLVKWVRKNWNWKGLMPKKYKKYMEIYDDCQDEQPEVKDFTGIVNDNLMDDPFHIKLSKSSVAYNHQGQGRDPLQMLISASVTYGGCIHRRRIEINHEKLLVRQNKSIDMITAEFNEAIDKLPEEYRANLKLITSSLEYEKLMPYDLKND